MSTARPHDRMIANPLGTGVQGVKMGKEASGRQVRGDITSAATEPLLPCSAAILQMIL